MKLNLKINNIMTPIDKARKDVEAAIRETLVIQNPQSINLAVEKIIMLLHPSKFESTYFKGELLVTLNCKNEWVNRVPRCLPEKLNRAEQWLWVDKNGYTLQTGEDFSAAMAWNSYPVKVYRLIRVKDAK